MSAPLVVNTVDGTCWTRRAVTRGGLALYAPQDVCRCPEFVMATEAELAEHGIVGSADVLPMPVGPEFDPVEELIGANLARFEEELENARLRLALASAQRGRRELRARVAELEAERHSTNEALSDVMVERRAAGDRVAELKTRFLPKVCECGHTGLFHTVPEPHSCFAGKLRDAEPCGCGSYRQLPLAEAERRVAARHAARSADRLTALFAPTQVLGDAPRQLAECSVCRAPRGDWCPDCGVCASNCFGLRDSAKCTHPRAPWAVRDA